MKLGGLALAFCALISLSAADSATQRGIARGPQNTAVDLSVASTTTVVLECEASSPRPTSRVSWTEFITNEQGAPISDNDVVLSHPNADRYAIDWDGNQTYNLVISPTILTDGGAYRCIDVNDASVPQYAQVITIVAPPNCTTNIPEDGLVLEDQYYTMECNVYYQGNVAPTMTWTGPGDFIWTTTTTPTTVWAGFAVNATRFMSYQTFDLTVNFTASGFIQTNYASNVPTLNYTVSTPALNVNWGPKTIYYVPEQETYEIGTQIECHADANPAANFFWQNMATNERWEDYRLYTYDNLIGSQVMWCHAQNIIGHNVYSADLFFNLTVNPRTTTPVPTTTPTTTPVPAEADCDDLTGRWTAYTPHHVDMCLDVNNTNYGRVVGILRNETDPYFVELRGRVVPYNTKQIGFTGIWPLNLEVISFIATCNKCYGNETMWLNAIVRSVQDNTECADAGDVYYSKMYQFYRTGPACQGMLREAKLL